MQDSQYALCEAATPLVRRGEGRLQPVFDGRNLPICQCLEIPVRCIESAK